MKIFSLRSNLWGGRLASLLFILTVYCSSLSAQQKTNDHFIDYSEMNESILKNLKTAVMLSNFGGSGLLRKQVQALPLGAKAKMTALIKPCQKEMKPAELVKSRKDGILMICKYYRPFQGRPEKAEVIATASTLTADGICVTNWHVFMNFIQPELKLHPADSLIFVVTAKGEIYPIEKILAFSKDADAALFKVNTGKSHLSAIPMGNDLDAGETVHVISNPEGYLYYYSKGVVARNSANHKIGPMANRMEITADYAKGSSGGPILDDKGNIAGMVSTTTQIYYRNNENLQMVIKLTIPIRSIKTMMD